MTLERQHGKIIWICDNCGDSLSTETNEFDDALAILRDEGWRVLPPRASGSWEHFCTACRFPKHDVS